MQTGGTLIEASSGNQGIATALIGAIKKYKVVITVFEKASQEKIQTLKAYSAQVITCPLTSLVSDPQSYHSQAVLLHKQTQNSFMLTQYYNIANAQAHYSMLGPEIWRQTAGKITHFIAAAGTGGTVSGAGRYLKEQNPAIRVIAVDAQNSYRSTNGNPQLYKLDVIRVDFVSPVLDNSVIDEFLCVTDEQVLFMLKFMATDHGFLIGPSSGAVAYAVQEYSKKLGSNDLAVIIFGDSGRAYLTKNFY